MNSMHVNSAKKMPRSKALNISHYFISDQTDLTDPTYQSDFSLASIQQIENSAHGNLDPFRSIVQLVIELIDRLVENQNVEQQ